jgi:transitional endoplasmic reticulum ATPase
MPSPSLSYCLNDLGALSNEIQELQNCLSLSLFKSELIRRQGLSPHRGIIVSGPMGTGKTHLCNAIISQLHVHSVIINGWDLISQVDGELEANLKNVFARATQQEPSILFIDDLDVILKDSKVMNITLIIGFGCFGSIV